jgi:hypothetical protein
METSPPSVFASGTWQLEYDRRDGARLTRLTYDGHDLLTVAPHTFRPPVKDYGRYETRPVYGYDDCFPTVDACPAPWNPAVALPDHGELCWSDAWQVAAAPHRISFSVAAKLWPARFTRELVFRDTNLEWRYTVANDADSPLPFIHVAHALLPRQTITGVALPEFAELFDEMAGRTLPASEARRVAEHLLALPRGHAAMLLLQNVNQGCVTADFATGLRLEVGFDPARFPTLGIWWNNGGYPDEAGRRRTECAFEPIAGAYSSLSKSVQAGRTMTVAPRSAVTWTVAWRLSRP